MLENPQMWLNLNNSAEKTGTKITHSYMEKKTIASKSKFLIVVLCAKGETGLVIFFSFNK